MVVIVRVLAGREDEGATIDNETERLIQDALRNLRRERTCFVIAYRLTTVREADRIYVLGDGRVAESRTHEKLLGQGGKYTELCAAGIS